MRLQIGRPQDSTNARVAYFETQTANMRPQQRQRPVRNRNTDIARLATCLRLYSRAIGPRESVCGRPDRGESASLAIGLLQQNRTRHLQTVRKCTPTNLATSAVATPSASNRTA